jgi:hypothetical protein
VIDATNVAGDGRPEGFESLAAFVKSQTGGPVAKAFNANFAALYDRLGEARTPPSMVYAADEEARAVTEQLIKDAGYEPVSAGGLENAGAVENFLGVIFAVAQAGTGRFWYRFAPPGEVLDVDLSAWRGSAGRRRRAWRRRRRSLRWRAPRPGRPFPAGAQRS